MCGRLETSVALNAYMFFSRASLLPVLRHIVYLVRQYDRPAYGHLLYGRERNWRLIMRSIKSVKINAAEAARWE